MSGVADALAGALSGKPVKESAFRGPSPPYFVCTECGSMSDKSWTNPILVTLKKLGMYQGEVTGGVGHCDGCEPIVLARFEKKQPGPKQMVDCPAEFKHATVENYLQRPEAMEAIEAAMRFASEGADHDLYICGPVGVGKTSLACAIGNDLANALPLVRFVRVSVLLVRLQESMHAEGEHANLTDYVEPTALVLDDVGVNKGSDYARQTLQTLYDMRRDLGRRTIWTSNLNLDELSRLFDDDRLSSRIAGAADIVWLGGDDLRVNRHVRELGGRQFHQE